MDKKMKNEVLVSGIIYWSLYLFGEMYLGLWFDGSASNAFVLGAGWAVSLGVIWIVYMKVRKLM